MIAALLPLLEALGAEGGASASLGGGLEGMLGGLGRTLGGTSKFGSQKELGDALRQISDLHGNIQASQAAMEQKREQQEQVANKARDDERQYAFSDPAHKDQLADLARQQQAHQEEIRTATRQMNDLRARAAVTTDPTAARQSQLGQATSIIGLAQAAPQIRNQALNYIGQQVANSPAGKAVSTAGQVGANLGSNFVTPTAGGVISEAASDLGGMAKSALTGNVSNLAVQLSKLPQHIVRWSESLVESQRSISKFNGTLAMTFAQADRRGIVRAIESGARTGGSTSELSSSLQDLYDTLQPVKDSVTNFISSRLASSVTLLTEIAKQVAGMTDTVRLLAAYVTGGSKGLVGELANMMAEKQAAENARGAAGGGISALLDEARARDPRRPFGGSRR